MSQSPMAISVHCDWCSLSLSLLGSYVARIRPVQPFQCFVAVVATATKPLNWLCRSDCYLLQQVCKLVYNCPKNGINSDQSLNNMEKADRSEMEPKCVSSQRPGSLGFNIIWA